MTMITPSYLGETIEYSSLHACRSTLEDPTHLTPHDAAQPNLLDFFDFTNAPWATPPSPPAPVTAQSLGHDPCTPASLGP